MFNLNQLRTFVMVVERGSFNKVAEEEYLSANAIMMQINNLENELGGTKLLIRNKRRGQTLTPAGEKLYEEAKKILRVCDEVKQQVIDVDEREDNTIRIMVSYGNSLYFYKDLLSELHRRHPEIRLELVDTIQDCKTSSNIWRNFSEWADIAISHISDIQITNNFYIYEGVKFTGTVINTFPYRALVDSNHRLAGKSEISFEDLIGERVSVAEELWYKTECPLEEYLEKHYTGIELESIFLPGTDTYNACANDGLVVIESSDSEIVHPFIKGIPIKSDDESFLNHLGFVYVDPPKPCVKKFIYAVREILREMPDIIKK